MLALGLALLVAAAPSPSHGDAIASQHRARRRVQLAGMGVLGGWALVNIAGGVAGARVDRDRKFFHQGNAIWNSVNLAIAIAGIAGNARKRAPPDSLAAARRVQRRTQRTYFVNALVDLVYIAAGTATIAIGQHYAQHRVRGYGQAVVFQGAWLFAFDVGMLIAHERVNVRAALTRDRPPVVPAGTSTNRRSVRSHNPRRRCTDHP